MKFEDETETAGESRNLTVVSPPAHPLFVAVRCGCQVWPTVLTSNLDTYEVAQCQSRYRTQDADEDRVMK